MEKIWLIPLIIWLSLATTTGIRYPPGIPFPYKEELEYLTSDEEERLIYGRDMSVINEKIQDIPEQRIEAPIRDEGPPVPTMDPPLPLSTKKRPLPPLKKKKSHRGFPFKIPRALSVLSMMTTPLTRKPRMRSSSMMPIPTYRSRPSTLVSSEPDQLEMAFKRIEIMASRAGLNMSSMPRSTQLQVVKRLVPKLPPRMSSLVKSALESNSDKMYHFLPEAMKDPLGEEHEAPDFSSYHFDEDIKDAFTESTYKTKGTHFDPGKISLTTSGEDHSDVFSTYHHSDENGGGLSSGLLPPSENSHGDFGFDHDDRNLDKIVASPLVADFEAHESQDSPVIISTGSGAGRQPKGVKVSSIKSVTLSPIRVSLPTKDKIPTVRPTPRPIRVSIISKETISTKNSTTVEPVIKVIHVEPIPPDEEEEVSGTVQEIIEPEATKLPAKSSTQLHVKGISGDIIKEEEAKHKKERKPQPLTTTTQRPLTTPSPDLLKLDMYDDWTEESEDTWGDPYELSEDEIAATMAELRKYEEQGIFDNSLEQDFPWRLAPHPLEYPDHPDHPKDSEEDKTSKVDKEKETVPSKTPSTTSTTTTNGGIPPKRPPPFEPRRPPFGRPPMRRPFPPKRPPHHFRRPPRPPPGPRPPFRINEVTVSEIPKEYNQECDYFSDALCLVVQDYPIEAISEAMEKHPDSSSLLVKEPEVSNWVDGIAKSQENSYNFKHYFGLRRSEDETTHRHRDFAGEGGFLCPSKVAYGQVKKAKSSSSGEWKYIVNYAENTQTLRLEKCLSPGNTCSYVMPHYRTACTQVYNYHRLLAWDSEKGLHVDVFKVPTCCTCHVQGYYIPQQQHGFTPVRRRDLPPRLKFAPPRTPHGRGSKKMPPPPYHYQNYQPVSLLKPVIPTTTKPPPLTKSPTMAPQSKDLKDDLHELLAQYSALREKIAKKKNDNIQVSYSVSVSNGTDSLKPKTRESRTSQFPSKLKPLLKLKLLAENLKKFNSTSMKGKPLLRSKVKNPLARALLLARLKQKLNVAKSRTLRGRSMKLGRSEDGMSSTGSTGSKSKVRLQNRIQLLRSRLNKYNEKRKEVDTVRLGSKGKKSSGRGGSETTSQQRLRLASSRPSKVNYSYHPIMDYFNSRQGKQIQDQSKN